MEISTPSANGSQRRISRQREATPQKPICYLCGRPIRERPSQDHVPPLQFFPKSLRPIRNPNLITLETHEACNQSYKLDEDYFLHSIGPLAIKSFTGGHLWKDIERRLGKPNEQHLRRLIAAEFEERPGGLILPVGRVAKRVKPRIHRVAFKIARGLFFVETGRVLPESTPRRFEIVNDENPPGDHLQAALSQPSRGRHAGVFDYKLFSSDRYPFHQIAMLFWDSIAWVVTFHDPTCSCEKCGRSRAKPAGTR